MGSVIEFVRECDFFPKVDTLYLTQTSTGGLASLVTYAVISVLIAVHGWQWLYPPTRQIISVPNTVDRTIPLEFDVTVSTDCEKLLVLHADVGGHVQMLMGEVEMEMVDFREQVRKRNKRLSLPSEQEEIEGCRIRGKLTLPKVDGRLLIVPMASVAMGQVGKILTHLDPTINFSHIIDRFSFGDKKAQNPLEGEVQVAMHAHEHMQYFLSILDSQYEGLLGHLQSSHQYALTGYLGLAAEHDVAAEKPGIIFRWTLDGIMVTMRRERPPFLQWLLGLVGMIGGLYLAAGCLVRFIGNLGRIGHIYQRVRRESSLMAVISDEKPADQAAPL